MTGPRRLHPFDAGLQPERTALAWRRTALALVIGALGAVRILPPLLGAWVIVPAGSGAFVAVFVLIAAHRRYLEQHTLLAIAPHNRVPLPDGLLPGLVALLTVGGGIASLFAVLAGTHR